MKRTPIITAVVAVGLACGVWSWPGCDGMRISPPTAEPVAEYPGADPVGAPARSGVDEGTRYTILLSTYTGPNHAANAKQVKEFLAADRNAFAKKGDLLVVHKEAGSDLYWNRTYSDAEKAKDDMMKARGYRFPDERQPAFPGAITVPMLPAEYGPPEWNLKTAATWEYEYTVLVGEYEDSPKDFYVGRRIKDCVEHVRELRRLGFKAYYYHGPAKSLVTVGLFYEAAAQQQVMQYKEDHGRKIPVFGPKLADPEIEKIMKTQEPPLSCLAWNGRKQYRITKGADGKEFREIVGSVLFHIPRSAAESREALERRLKASREQRLNDLRNYSEPGETPRNP